MTTTKPSTHQVPVNILVNAFSAVADVKIAINWAILEKPYAVSLSGVRVQGRRTSAQVAQTLRDGKKLWLFVATDEMWPLR